ncbi:NADP-dependent oxidoreductase [Microbacterium awajiense]|uniref:NADP-dependent oxidoreductase n=1 Tax=Microbacterium awajiense TaxID=415214 RepID=A0ABP7ACF3_9MICO
MAHAITYDRFGGPDVLSLTEIPDPVPDAGEVAIAVEAAGVNPIDIKLRTGARASAPLDGPRGVGFDGAGVISGVGEDVSGFAIGDPVVFFGVPGAYATTVVAPAAHVQARPAAVSAAEGAAIGIPVGTAYQVLRSLRVRSGDTLLLHAGSGAVGQAAIQLAVLWGARVVATASPRRFARVEELGATPVAYGDGLLGRLREASPDGYSVALDGAGTDEALDTSRALVADHDRVATIVQGARAAELGIRAFSGGSPQPLTEIEQTWRREAVPVALALLAAGRFSIEIAASVPLAAADDAQRLVESGADGKVVLTP